MKRRDVRRALQAASRVPVPPSSGEVDVQAVYTRFQGSVEPYAGHPSGSPALRRRPVSRYVAVCTVLATAIGGLVLSAPSQVEVQLHREAQVTAPAAGPSAQVMPIEQVPTTSPAVAEPGVAEAAEQLAPYSPSPSATAAPSAHGAPEPTEPLPSPSPETPAYGYAGTTPQYGISLGARMQSDGVHLDWSVFDGGEFASYVVIRAEGSSPSWPADQHTRVIRRVPRGARTTLVDPEPWTQRPVYRVVAVDDRQQEVARSRAVTADDRAPSADDGDRPRPALP